MPGHQRHPAHRRDREPDDAPAPDPVAPGGQSAARKAELDADIDSVLDEIDGVLESNAEEFVAGFVQKGGQ